MDNNQLNYDLPITPEEIADIKNSSKQTGVDIQSLFAITTKQAGELRDMNQLLLAGLIVLLVALLALLFTLGGYLYTSYLEKAAAYQNLQDEMQYLRIELEKHRD